LLLPVVAGIESCCCDFNNVLLRSPPLSPPLLRSRVRSLPRSPPRPLPRSRSQRLWMRLLSRPLPPSSKDASEVANTDFVAASSALVASRPALLPLPAPFEGAATGAGGVDAGDSSAACKPKRAALLRRRSSSASSTAQTTAACWSTDCFSTDFLAVASSVPSPAVVWLRLRPPRRRCPPRRRERLRRPMAMLGAEAAGQPAMRAHERPLL